MKHKLSIEVSELGFSQAAFLRKEGRADLDRAVKQLRPRVGLGASVFRPANTSTRM